MFRKRSYCHIWIKRSSLAQNPDVQSRFNEKMARFTPKEPFQEADLVAFLKALHKKLQVDICYHLSSKHLTNATRMTYEASQQPRTDRTIKRH